MFRMNITLPESLSQILCINNSNLSFMFLGRLSTTSSEVTNLLSDHRNLLEMKNTFKLKSWGQCYKRFMSDIVWVYTNNLWVLTKSNAMKIFYQSRLITNKFQYYKDIVWVWAHIPWNYFYEWTITLKSPKTFMGALQISSHV